MGISMLEVFREKFPVKPEDIFSPSPEKNKQIMEEFQENLDRAQKRFERTDRGVVYRSFK